MAAGYSQILSPSVLIALIALGRYSQERAISLNTELAAGDYALTLSMLDTSRSADFTFNMWYSKDSGDSGKKLVLITKLA